MSVLILVSFTSTILSATFAKMKSPLSMGAGLLFQIILSCLSTALTSNSSWFSYILFLVYLGALFVVFLYAITLCSNEQFTTVNMKSIFFLIPVGTFLLLASFFFDKELSFFILSFYHNSMSSSLDPPLSHKSILAPIFNPPTVPLTYLVTTYLLLALVVIVKITSGSKGPLRLHF